METKTAALTLAALAQETRLTIYRHLVEAGPAGVRAGQIAEHLALPNATLSFHLAQLRQSGLIAARREGRQIIYSADYAAMNGLLDFLTENCCGGGGCASPTTARPTTGSPS